MLLMPSLLSPLDTHAATLICRAPLIMAIFVFDACRHYAFLPYAIFTPPYCFLHSAMHKAAPYASSGYGHAARLRALFTCFRQPQIFRLLYALLRQERYYCLLPRAYIAVIFAARYAKMLPARYAKR